MRRLDVTEISITFKTDPIKKKYVTAFLKNMKTSDGLKTRTCRILRSGISATKLSSEQYCIGIFKITPIWLRANSLSIEEHFCLYYNIIFCWMCFKNCYELKKIYMYTLKNIFERIYSKCFYASQVNLKKIGLAHCS